MYTQIPLRWRLIRSAQTCTQLTLSTRSHSVPPNLSLPHHLLARLGLYHLPEMIQTIEVKISSHPQTSLLDLLSWRIITKTNILSVVIQRNLRDNKAGRLRP